MKKLSLLLGLPLLGLAALLIWVGGANAHIFSSGDNIRLGQDERIDNTLFAAAQTIDISSEVFGDVICVGQNITITGKVHGDVICVGQTINVTGSVEGDVRLAGQTVTLGSDITGNASVATQSFTLESDGSVGRDLSLATEDASINGSVGRDAAVGGSRITVAGELGRDFKGELRILNLASTAKINGNIDITSQEDIRRADGAFVGGKISRTEAPRESKADYGTVFGFTFGWFVYVLLATLFMALALVLLFPRMLHNVTDQAFPAPWRALLIGFAACLALPVLLIVLSLTIIGIPLAITLGLAWLVVLLLSPTLTGYYLGRLVARNSRHVVLTALVGSTLWLILLFIPIIGFITFLFTSLLGPGMLVLEMFRRTPRPDYRMSAPATAGRSRR